MQAIFSKRIIIAGLPCLSPIGMQGFAAPTGPELNYAAGLG